MKRRKLVDRWLGPGAALALGLAAAFFTFAMPAVVMGAALDALGLGVLTPVAAPVRAGVICLAALITALPAWFLFRILDRASGGAVYDDYADDLEWPVFEAIEDDADELDLDLDYMIDDAPLPRRPISAGSEVGEPLLLDTPYLPVPEAHAAAVADAAARETELLLDRLAEGLRRRPLPRVRATPRPVANDRGMSPLASSPRPEPADDALRSALAELQRIAGQRI